MAEPRIERLSRTFRRRILERDRAALLDVSRIYANVSRTAIARARAYHAMLVEEADRLGVSLAEISRPPYHPSWALQRDRLEALARSLGDELRLVARDASGVITAAQVDAIELALREAEEFSAALIRGQVPRNLRAMVGSGLSASWSRPPLESFAHLVGATGDGSPLLGRLAEYGDEAVAQITNGLRTSFLLGEGVDLMSRRISGAMDGNRNRAMLVSRTETIRAYRYANHESYRANRSIVRGWIWSADLGNRTCAACISKHGTRHPVEETLYDHPRGRCRPLPITPTNAELSETLGIPELADARYDDPYARMETGEAWLARQGKVTQDRILGKARAEIYRDPDNGLGLSDLVEERPNRVWGPTIGVRPLRDLDV